MSRNIVKILDKGFSDISAGEKMLISSPEKISEFIFKIPKGSYLSIKELRRGLALKAGADNTCPVTTGIFLRMAIEQHKDDENFPYWRVVDEKHPVVKKLNLDGNRIKMRRVDDGIPYSEKPTQPHKSFTAKLPVLLWYPRTTFMKMQKLRFM